MDERNLPGKPKVETESGAEAKEQGKEISIDDLKERVGEDIARLAVQLDQVSRQFSEIKKKIPTEAQMAIDDGRAQEAGVDPEILAEYQRLSVEWEGLMKQVNQEKERVHALEAGVDLDQKEQQLTERIGKIEAKLKAEQDGWAKTMDRYDGLRKESMQMKDKDELFRNDREQDAARKKADQHALQIGELSLAYLAAKAELAAISNGEWSDKPIEDWLPSTDTKTPVFNETWGKKGNLEFHGTGQSKADTTIWADTLRIKKQANKDNRENNMNSGHNIEDLAL